VNFTVSPLIRKCIEHVLEQDSGIIDESIKNKFERFRNEKSESKSNEEKTETNNNSESTASTSKLDEISLAELNLLAEQLRAIHAHKEKNKTSKKDKSKKDNKKKDNFEYPLWFRDLVVDSEPVQPKFKLKELKKKKPEELTKEERFELAKYQLESKQYFALTKNVRKEEDETYNKLMGNIQDSKHAVKEMNESITLGVNFIFTAITTFVAGYWVFSHAYGTTTGVLGGLAVAIVCVMAEFWLFIIKNSKYSREAEKQRQLVKYRRNLPPVALLKKNE